MMSSRNERIRLPYSTQWIDEQDIARVVKVLRSSWLTQGPEVNEFEQALCRLTGARYAVATSNGTAALYISCRALGLGPGDVGVTTPFSFAASANCIALCGARPDFVDIDQKDLCLDPQALRRYCEQKGIPKVVIPVDFAGVPAKLEEIHGLAQEYGFRIIEDAAHAIGSSYVSKGQSIRCGSCVHSDVAIFSFHPVKNVTSAEGGAVLTNDSKIYYRVKKLVNHGIERDKNHFEGEVPGNGWPYEVQDLSFNFRLSDLHAALGVSQLTKLDLFKVRRQHLAVLYRKGLKNLEDKGLLILPYWPKNSDICWHIFVIRVTEKANISRQKLYDELGKRGIGAQIHYWPIHLHPFYKTYFDHKEGDFPKAEFAGRTCLSIPLFPKMKDEDAEFVIESIRKIFETF